MRPVTVFKNDNYVPGKGFQKIEDFKGKFHGFGLDVWEQELASISYSVAIIEKEDGTVSTATVDMIRFDDTDTFN